MSWTLGRSQLIKSVRIEFCLSAAFVYSQQKKWQASAHWMSSVLQTETCLRAFCPHVGTNLFWSVGSECSRFVSIRAFSPDFCRVLKTRVDWCSDWIFQVNSGLSSSFPSSGFHALMPAVVVSVGTTQELCGSAASHVVVLPFCADINAAASAGLHHEFCSSMQSAPSSHRLTWSRRLLRWTWKYFQKAQRSCLFLTFNSSWIMLAILKSCMWRGRAKK